MGFANRTSGVAPLGVFFDAVDTANTGVAQPFAYTSGVTQPTDLEGSHFEWDFGDASSGTWTTTGKSKNTATGYTAAHVYETPGTYTVTLRVTDTLGAVASYTETITVSAFSGTTYYVAANGNDSNPGTEAQPFLTGTKAWSMVGTNRAILFRRGDTFAIPTKNITTAGPGIIGAYGTGDAPILTSTVDGQDSSPITVSASDWRLVDLVIQGPGAPYNEATTNAGLNGAWGLQVSATTHVDYPLFLRVSLPGWNVGIGSTATSTVFANPHDGWIIAECEVESPGLNGIYLGGRRLALLGNNVDGPLNSHVVRCWQGHKAAFSNNRLWDPSVTSGTKRHALKLHSPGYNTYPESRYVTVTDNIIRGKEWTVAIDPQNAQSDERVSHVVVERNRFHGGFNTIQNDINVAARNILVRNNVFDATGDYSGYAAVAVARRGVEPQPDDVRVYGNTVYRGDAATSVYAVSGSSGATNVKVRSNLVCAPLTTTKAGVTGTAAVNDYNPVVAADVFTDAAGGDFTLVSALGTGVSLPEVLEDFTRDLRLATAEAGAYTIPALTINADPPSAGTVRIWGTKPAGSTVGLYRRA